MLLVLVVMYLLKIDETKVGRTANFTKARASLKSKIHKTYLDYAQGS